ncbi:MAG TPA: hypothetical protein VMV94_02330 [Phycisphaerae bacterium]|nr:hypothetical protein [Phycisphaerae bacterium]
MATVGHTFAGLSIGGLADAKSRGGALRNAWPGFMVLMGHLVDIVEWGIILAAPGYFDHHYLTNSPVLTAGIGAVVCLGLAIFARLRKPWPYLLVVLAIFSHLLLDDHLVRVTLADAYQGQAATESPSLYTSVLAEAWLYGLLFICVWLLQASRRADCPRSGRAAARVLVALAIFASITRNPAVWMPVYVLAGLHGLLMIRRDLRPKSLWNLVPVLPVFALLAVELWAGRLYEQARELDRQGAYPEAAAMYRRVIAAPTRSQNLAAYIWLSECQRRDKDYAAAEATLMRGLAITDQPWWARAWLGRLYAHSCLRGTAHYQPERARELLEQVINDRSPAEAKRYARFLLANIQDRGTTD